MNNDTFMSMSEDLRRIVHDGFQALRGTTIVMPQRRQIDAYNAFREAGGTIYVPTPEEREQFAAAAAPLREWFVDNYGAEWLDTLDASIATCEAQIDAEYEQLN